jgi:hypothetical protein
MVFFKWVVGFRSRGPCPLPCSGIIKKGPSVKPKYGITSKLFVWFFITLLIFYGTILVLYINFQEIVKLSEDIVNKNTKISSISKKMIENLLNMEENDKKYHQYC